MSPPLRETRVPAVQLHRHCCINPEIEKKNKMNFEGTGSYAFSRISCNGINKKGKIDPEIVILGGSVAIKIPGFVEDVEQRVKTKVYPNIQPLVKVVKTNLSEDSGLLGAACLAFLQV